MGLRFKVSKDFDNRIASSLVNSKSHWHSHVRLAGGRFRLPLVTNRLSQKHPIRDDAWPFPCEGLWKD